MIVRLQTNHGTQWRVEKIQPSNAVNPQLEETDAN
jgi:hypothetical protein